MAEVSGFTDKPRIAVGGFARVELWQAFRVGANVRVYDHDELSLLATPVVGWQLITLWDRIPLTLEVEFLDDRHPVKAAVLVTWRRE